MVGCHWWMLQWWMPRINRQDYQHLQHENAKTILDSSLCQYMWFLKKGHIIGSFYPGLVRVQAFWKMLLGAQLLASSFVWSRVPSSFLCTNRHVNHPTIRLLGAQELRRKGAAGPMRKHLLALTQHTVQLLPKLQVPSVVPEDFPPGKTQWAASRCEQDVCSQACLLHHPTKREAACSCLLPVVCLLLLQHKLTRTHYSIQGVQCQEGLRGEPGGTLFLGIQEHLSR